MKLKLKEKLCVSLFAVCLNGVLTAQVIDRVIGVVGDKAILLSDVEAQVQQLVQNGFPNDSILRCNVMQELILQRMMLTQAERDSITASDAQVDQELNKKIRYFVQQMGSVERLENYLGKSISEIKDEYREKIRQQLVIQQMQGKVVGDIKVSPGEVVAFYKKIPADSLPLIESEVEFAQIVKKPAINIEEKLRVKAQLEKIRKEIIDGKSFATMAVLHSKDPGSATKGGELGFVNRGDLVPEFEAAAFALKPKEISEVVETMYGFHIIQLIERRGESINVRHILLSPSATAADLEQARLKCDSIYYELKSGRITFEKAVLKYSDDTETKNNSGLVINPATGGSEWELSQLDQQVFFVLDKLNIGEFSEPVVIRNADRKEGYRILLLKQRTKPHRANLEEDYHKIQQAAEGEKRQQQLQEWVKRKRKNFYIQIDDEFQSCDFVDEWKIAQEQKLK